MYVPEYVAYPVIMTNRYRLGTGILMVDCVLQLSSLLALQPQEANDVGHPGPTMSSVSNVDPHVDSNIVLPGVGAPAPRSMEIMCLGAVSHARPLHARFPLLKEALPG